MPGYIFTPPAASYDMAFNYDELLEWIKKSHSWQPVRGHQFRKLGTTLTFVHREAKDEIDVVLYDTTIARIAWRYVTIERAINQHGSLATTHWVQKILSDNHFSWWLAREKFTYNLPWPGNPDFPFVYPIAAKDRT